MSLIANNMSRLVRVHAGVDAQAVNEATQALAQIPQSDLQLLIQAGVVIDLLPDSRINVKNVGETKISSVNGKTLPTEIQIATKAGISIRPTRHIIVHEVGHAVSLLKWGDASEVAAEQYVLNTLRSSVDQAITAARMRADGMGNAIPPQFSSTGLFSALTRRG